MTINMLGVLISLNGCSFYMCPCCTGIRIWAGDGSDFDMNECPCWKFGGTRSAAIASFNSRAAASVDLSFSSTYLCMNPVHVTESMLCLVCRSKNICPRARMILPECERRCMRRINFCRKHAPPDHILNTITSFHELQHVLTTRGQDGQPGGGGGSSSLSRVNRRV